MWYRKNIDLWVSYLFAETKLPELVFSGPRFLPWDDGRGGGGGGGGSGSWFGGFFLFGFFAFLVFFNNEEEKENYKEYNRKEQ